MRNFRAEFSIKVIILHIKDLQILSVSENISMRFLSR